jgi:hypothetical protein
MKKLISLAILVAIVLLGCGAGGSGSITVEKTSLEPDEWFNVDYTVDSSLIDTAWVGVVPESVAHNAEDTWMESDSWDWCDEEGGSGTVELYAPSEPGKYEVRLCSGSEEEDKELAVVAIEVK